MGSMGMGGNMMGVMSIGGNMMDGIGMRHDVSFGKHDERKDEKVRSLHISLLSPPPLNCNLYLMNRPTLFLIQIVKDEDKLR